MTFNVVCHVRVTPIRGLNLTADDGDSRVEAQNPFLVAVIEPWNEKFQNGK